MKKSTKITIAVVLVAALALAIYLNIWGGKPQIENFNEISGDLEIMAQFALTYIRQEASPASDAIIIYFRAEGLKHNDGLLALSEAQAAAAANIYAGRQFQYMRVYRDAVFFMENERHNYGLIYAEKPISVLYREEFPQNGREYHRLNRRWYEWGSFGI